MKTELLNPQNSAVIFTDFQSQRVFGVAKIDRQTFFNNVLLLANAAKIFKVSTSLTIDGGATRNAHYTCIGDRNENQS